MPKLTDDIVREIAADRGEPAWLLQWRLDALHAWHNMQEPHWADFEYEPIDYDALNYYNNPASIDNSDLAATYEKMGLPESERRALLGMATDTVIDSRSVHTSYTAELRRLGIIFMPMSDAVREYPDLVKKYLGTVVPASQSTWPAISALKPLKSVSLNAHLSSQTKAPNYHIWKAAAHHADRATNCIAALLKSWH